MAVLIAIQNLGTVAIWRVAAKLEAVDVKPSNDVLRVQLDLNADVPQEQLELTAMLNG
ncbi:hypothetical protein [Bradyrhizobium sp. USDA 4506]